MTIPLCGCIITMQASFSLRPLPPAPHYSVLGAGRGRRSLGSPPCVSAQHGGGALLAGAGPPRVEERRPAAWTWSLTFLGSSPGSATATASPVTSSKWFCLSEPRFLKQHRLWLLTELR